MSLAESAFKALNRNIAACIYCMVTEEVSGVAFFKFGISRNPLSRVSEVQTGCPVPIVEVLMLPAISRREAMNVEQATHMLLAKYKTSGEWFRFELADPEHKKDFNGALKMAAAGCRAKGWKRASATSKAKAETKPGEFQCSPRTAMAMMLASGVRF